VLGFDNERFEPARGDDAEIRIGHTSWSTTFLADSKASWGQSGVSGLAGNRKMCGTCCMRPASLSVVVVFAWAAPPMKAGCVNNRPGFFSLRSEGEW
jgi:hypothetical protein